MNNNPLSRFCLPILWRGLPLILLVCGVMQSCSTDDTQNIESSLFQNDGIEFFLEDESVTSESTRGIYPIASTVEKYAVFSFYNENKKAHVKNCIMTKKADGTWKKSKIMNFPGKNALDFYMLHPSFDDADSYEMTMDDKYFVLTMPDSNYKQKDFMFSSLINKTKEQTNNKITFKMKHLFSYLRFLCKLTNEQIEVYVHSIRLHNLQSKGTFTYNRDKERAGTWDISTTDYGTYTFELPKDSMLTTNKQISLHTSDSLLFVMPQKPANIWEPDVMPKTSDADAAHHAYVEVVCRVWKKRSDADIAANVPPAADAYVGCSATTWASVYYPLKAGTAWTSKVTPYSGNYNVIITFTGGYTADGEDFLKKYTDDELEMSSDEPVESFIVTVPWEDDTTNSVSFNM